MDHDHHHGEADIPEGAETVKDPVCGMTVVVGPDMRQAMYKDKTFHFCSKNCQTKFEGDPWFYASGRAAKHTKAAPADVQFTVTARLAPPA